jgi:hypothetical protein
MPSPGKKPIRVARARETGDGGRVPELAASIQDETGGGQNFFNAYLIAMPISVASGLW